MDSGDLLLTLVLTEEQQEELLASTGVSLRALKITSELALERAVEEKKLRHLRACPVSAVDLR